MTIDEAILYMMTYREQLKQSISTGIEKDIEAFDKAIEALYELKIFRDGLVNNTYLNHLKEGNDNGDKQD